MHITTYERWPFPHPGPLPSDGKGESSPGCPRKRRGWNWDRRAPLFALHGPPREGTRPTTGRPGPPTRRFLVPMRRHKTVEATYEHWPFPHSGPLPSDGRGRIVARLSAKEPWLELG